MTGHAVDSMRIAFCGAHGTGKSTLVRPLAAKLRLDELPTPGRWLADHGVAVNTGATVETQAIGWFLQYQFEYSLPSWISSRSMLDVLAYAAVPAATRVLDDIEAHLLEQMNAATRCHIAGGAYDVLIYTPPRIPLVADDVRIADSGFQRDTDAFIASCLDAWNVGYHEIDVTDIDAAAQIERIIAAI